MLVSEVNPRLAGVPGFGLCACGGRATCTCKPMTARQYRRAVRPALGLGGDPLLDRPNGDPSGFFGVASGFAHIFGFGEVTPMPKGPPEVMIRASNLANLVAKGLINTKSNERKDALLSFGDMIWVNSVLRLAEKVGGPLGVQDAVRFSLAMHFVIGILHDQAGQDSAYSRPYRIVAAEMKQALANKKNPNYSRVEAMGLSGLGALGGALGGLSEKEFEAAGFGQRCNVCFTTKQTLCSNSTVRDNWKARQKLIVDTFKEVFGREPSNSEIVSWDKNNACVKAALKDLMVKSKNNGTAPPVTPGGTSPVSILAAKAVDGAEELADSVNGVICSGLKKILGEQIGKIICDVLSMITEFTKAMVGSTIIIVKQVVMGIIEFIKLLVQGRTEDAIKALMKNVMGTLFVAPPIGPLLVTFLGIEGATMNQKLERLVKMGEEVYDDSPMFIVQLATAIMSCIPVPSQNSIVSLIAALNPAIAVLGAEIAAKFKIAKAKAKKVISKLINVGLAIFTKAIEIKTFVSSIYDQIEKAGGPLKWLEKNADSLSPKYKAEWERCKANAAAGKPDCNLFKVIESDITGFAKALTSFKLGAIVDSLKDLMTIMFGIPEDAPAAPPPPPPAPKPFEQMNDSEKSLLLATYIDKLDFNRLAKDQQSTVEQNVIRAVDSLGKNIPPDARFMLMQRLLSKFPASEHVAIVKALSPA